MPPSSHLIGLQRCFPACRMQGFPSVLKWIFAFIAVIAAVAFIDLVIRGSAGAAGCPRAPTHAAAATGSGHCKWSPPSPGTEPARWPGTCRPPRAVELIQAALQQQLTRLLRGGTWDGRGQVQVQKFFQELVHLVVATLHHLVGVHAAHHGGQLLPLLSLPHARVHVVDEVLHGADHGDDGLLGTWLVPLPQHRLEQQRVLVFIQEKPSEHPQTTKCSGKWIGVGDKCFYFSEDTKNWTASKIFCSSQGSELAQIDTPGDMV
ncbi:C-type lectin domain family 2 member A isoform X2 [Myotis myotis]|uniref:C-type lectin domain family 2 member A isoform X2 n=1 Tax=Myotis myotis TaxID=51298 RepID=UPI00174B145A|nr:C-type lectin domain family 2 member A isoform X2 [Myotis myotis]